MYAKFLKMYAKSGYKQGEIWNTLNSTLPKRECYIKGILPLLHTNRINPVFSPFRLLVLNRSNSRNTNTISLTNSSLHPFSIAVCKYVFKVAISHTRLFPSKQMPEHPPLTFMQNLMLIFHPISIHYLLYAKIQYLQTFIAILHHKNSIFIKHQYSFPRRKAIKHKALWNISLHSSH